MSVASMSIRMADGLIGLDRAEIYPGGAFQAVVRAATVGGFEGLLWRAGYDYGGARIGVEGVEATGPVEGAKGVNHLLTAVTTVQSWNSGLVSYRGLEYSKDALN